LVTRNYTTIGCSTVAENISPTSASQTVGSTSSDQRIIAESTTDHVVTTSTADIVVSLASKETFGCCGTGQRIVVVITDRTTIEVKAASVISL
jgi:hypothetical protein